MVNNEFDTKTENLVREYSLYSQWSVGEAILLSRAEEKAAWPFTSPLEGFIFGQEGNLTTQVTTKSQT